MDLFTSALLIMVFIVLYVILIEIYNVLFRISGLTKDKSRFQVISLLTNSGYTTRESELISGNKFRRRLAIASMLTGYIFTAVIVSLIFNLVSNFDAQEIEDNMLYFGIAFGAFVLILIISNIPVVKKYFDKIIENAAHSAMRHSKYGNVITILDEYEKDCIAEIYINELPEFLNGKSIFESRIKDKYRMNVMMVKRKGRMIDVTKDTHIQVKDTLVIFGSQQNIKELFGIKKQDVEDKLEKPLVEENVIELIDNYGQDAMVQVTVNIVPDFLHQTPLFECGIKDKYLINVIMMKRDDKAVMVTKDTMIEQGDVLILYGPYANIKEAFLLKSE